MAYATQVMRNAADEFENRISLAVCSGIVGDSAHNYGYHRAANEVSADDYSRKLAGDRNGIDPSAADAIDMSMNPSDMRLVTGRFYNSWKDSHDLRLNYFREIIGTLDGRTVIYMDTQSGSQGSSDSSHLWHLHSGGLRCNANNAQAWKAWISIAVGESWADYCRKNPNDPLTHGVQPSPSPQPPHAPPFPLAAGQVYGPIDGPDWQHGGFYASEQATIRTIQQRLAANGCNPGGIDGIYGGRTKTAVIAYQRSHGLEADGLVGPQTWAKLMVP